MGAEALSWGAWDRRPKDSRFAEFSVVSLPHAGWSGSLSAEMTGGEFPDTGGLLVRTVPLSLVINLRLLEET